MDFFEDAYCLLSESCCGQCVSQSSPTRRSATQPTPDPEIPTAAGLLLVSSSVATSSASSSRGSNSSGSSCSSTSSTGELGSLSLSLFGSGCGSAAPFGGVAESELRQQQSQAFEPASCDSAAAAPPVSTGFTRKRRASDDGLEPHADWRARLHIVQDDPVASVANPGVCTFDDSQKLTRVHHHHHHHHVDDDDDDIVVGDDQDNNLFHHLQQQQQHHQYPQSLASELGDCPVPGSPLSMLDEVGPTPSSSDEAVLPSPAKRTRYQQASSDPASFAAVCQAGGQMPIGKHAKLVLPLSCISRSREGLVNLPSRMTFDVYVDADYKMQVRVESPDPSYEVKMTRDVNYASSVYAAFPGQNSARIKRFPLHPQIAKTPTNRLVTFVCLTENLDDDQDREETRFTMVLLAGTARQQEMGKLSNLRRNMKKRAIKQS